MLSEINTAMGITMHDVETRVLISIANGPRFCGRPLTHGSKWGEHGANLGRTCALALHRTPVKPSGARMIREGSGSTPKLAAE
jgi:hypothetical protein